MKLHFTYSESPTSQELAKRLEPLSVPYNIADVLVVVGGDGFMLRSLHKNYRRIPSYGVNGGTLGFLMNPYDEIHSIKTKIKEATEHTTYPLFYSGETRFGEKFKGLAFNEVTVSRLKDQCAKISLSINGKIRLDELVADGVLLSTPMGSTAYNMSAGGPILPLSSNMLSLTTICPFRPRGWKGALIPYTDVVKIENLTNDEYRTLKCVGDFVTTEDIHHVTIMRGNTIPYVLLFDKGYSLEEKVFQEQFNVFN